jgi:hypothetical protein
MARDALKTLAERSGYTESEFTGSLPLNYMGRDLREIYKLQYFQEMSPVTS